MFAHIIRVRMEFDFKVQLAQSEVDNKRLDEHFGQEFYIQDVQDMDWQRMGIDKIYRHKETGDAYTVEYKADRRAAATGNMFLETEVRQDKGKTKPGWGYYTIAQYLFYFIPPTNQVYVINMATLKQSIPYLTTCCEEKGPVRNNGYEASGLLVPLSLVGNYIKGSMQYIAP